MTIPQKTIYINFFDVIDPTKVNKFIQFCTDAIKQYNPTEVYFFISSNGGDVDSGFVLYNYLISLVLDRGLPAAPHGGLTRAGMGVITARPLAHAALALAGPEARGSVRGRPAPPCLCQATARAIREALTGAGVSGLEIRAVAAAVPSELGAAAAPLAGALAGGIITAFALADPALALAGRVAGASLGGQPRRGRVGLR